MFNLGLNPAYVSTRPNNYAQLRKNFKYVQWNIGAVPSKVSNEDSRMRNITHFMPLVSF